MKRENYYKEGLDTPLRALIKKNREDINKHTATIDRHSNSISEAEREIMDLEDGVTDLDNRVSALEERGGGSRVSEITVNNTEQSTNALSGSGEVTK